MTDSNISLSKFRYNHMLKMTLYVIKHSVQLYDLLNSRNYRLRASVTGLKIQNDSLDKWIDVISYEEAMLFTNQLNAIPLIIERVIGIYDKMDLNAL